LGQISERGITPEEREGHISFFLWELDLAALRKQPSIAAFKVPAGPGFVTRLLAAAKTDDARARLIQAMRDVSDNDPFILELTRVNRALVIRCGKCSVTPPDVTGSRISPRLLLDIAKVVREVLADEGELAEFVIYKAALEMPAVPRNATYPIVVVDCLKHYNKSSEIYEFVEALAVENLDNPVLQKLAGEIKEQARAASADLLIRALSTPLLDVFVRSSIAIQLGASAAFQNPDFRLDLVLEYGDGWSDDITGDSRTLAQKAMDRKGWSLEFLALLAGKMWNAGVPSDAAVWEALDGLVPLSLGWRWMAELQAGIISAPDNASDQSITQLILQTQAKEESRAIDQVLQIGLTKSGLSEAMTHVAQWPVRLGRAVELCNAISKISDATKKNLQSWVKAFTAHLEAEGRTVLKPLDQPPIGITVWLRLPPALISGSGSAWHVQTCLWTNDRKPVGILECTSDVDDAALPHTVLTHLKAADAKVPSFCPLVFSLPVHQLHRDIDEWRDDDGPLGRRYKISVQCQDRWTCSAWDNDDVWRKYSCTVPLKDPVGQDLVAWDDECLDRPVRVIFRKTEPTSLCAMVKAGAPVALWFRNGLPEGSPVAGLVKDMIAKTKLEDYPSSFFGLRLGPQAPDQLHATLLLDLPDLQVHDPDFTSPQEQPS
jgi:hypothetical protein